MTTTLKAKFDGKVLIPEEPVDLPQGRSLTIRVDSDDASNRAGGAFNGLAKLAEKLSQYPADPNSPGDLCAQHDHYLYGTPKQSDP